MNSEHCKTLETLHLTLERLNNAITPRHYAVRREEGMYVLVSPIGTDYEPSTAHETIERLITIRIAAVGR